MKEDLPDPDAPRITTIMINPARIRDVIGTGGKNIRQIIAETGVDYISVGALTHSARAADFSLEIADDEKL